MIAIVDYGLGNIRAFSNAYKSLDIPAFIATEESDLRKATKILLPGVGAFDRAMELLDRSGMRGALEEAALRRKLPVLGICVGMQILAKASDEGRLPGLGWIDGRVRRLPQPALGGRTLLPHMGWNAVAPKRSDPLFESLDDRSRFYFLHSYFFECASQESSLAETDYGARFSSVVGSGNIYGVQFHPEKSHANGTRLLRNFGAL